MQSVLWLGPAFVIAYGGAVVAPVVRHAWGGRAGRWASWCCLPIVLASPLVLPAENVGLRAVSAFVAIDISFKLVEYFRHWNCHSPRLGPSEYLRFLVPFPVLSAVYPDQRRRLTESVRPGPECVRLIGGAIGAISAILVVKSFAGVSLLRSNYVLNHACMLLPFVVAVESLSQAIWGVERLAGFDTRPIIHKACLSRTVAEFWRRYNYRVHDWLYRNLFAAAGGRRAPVRGVLLVFLVSGLFHELAFAVATSRVTGYQLAFFIIQAPAALASGPLERFARRRGLAGKIVVQIATAVFLGVSSILFFDGVWKVFPFIYVSQPPLP